jgi:predicted transcriptional regulator
MPVTYTASVCIGNTSLAIPLKNAARYPMPMGYLDQLARLRKAKGFTQSSLAERLGVEQPTVQRWEAGKREPSLAQLLELARILEVEPGNRRRKNLIPKRHILC